MAEEGNQFIRFDVFMVLFFLSIQIFDPINESVVASRGHSLVGASRTAMVNASAILDDVSTNSSKESYIAPTQNLQGITSSLFGYLIYAYRFASWALGSLWTLTGGLPGYLVNSYGIPLEWAYPVGSVIGFMNFIGMVQLLTGWRL